MQFNIHRNNGLAGKIIRYIVISCGSLLLVLVMLIVIQRRTTSIYNSQLNNIDALSTNIRDLSSSVTGVQLLVQRLLREKDLDSLEAIIERFNSQVQHSKACIDTIGAAQTELSEHLDTLTTRNQLVVDLFLRNDAGRANLVFVNESNPQYEQLLSEIEEYRSILFSEFEASAKKKLAGNSTVQLLTFIITAICIVFCIVTGIFLLRSVITPLRQLITMLSDIVNGNGDLTKRLNVASKDELGEMASLFNRFIEQQQAIFSQLSRTTTSLHSAAGALQSIADSFSEQSKDITTQSSVATQSTIETVSGFNNISDATNQMSQSVNTIASAIEEISASLTEVSRNCQHELTIAAEAHKQAEINNKVMHKLKNSIKEIDNILDSINDIADQTNMLALNATIEAASAGDAGKGFAVVASEVKELSKQTAEATENIGRNIAEMRQKTNSAIKIIEAIASIIDEINTISHTIASSVEEQSSTMNEISGNANTTNSVASGIANQVSTSVENIRMVARIINEVETVANENDQSSKKMIALVNDFTQLTEKVDVIVKQFKI